MSLNIDNQNIKIIEVCLCWIIISNIFYFFFLKKRETRFSIESFICLNVVIILSVWITSPNTYIIEFIISVLKIMK